VNLHVSISPYKNAGRYKERDRDGGEDDYARDILGRQCVKETYAK